MKLENSSDFLSRVSCLSIATFCWTYSFIWRYSTPESLRQLKKQSNSQPETYRENKKRIAPQNPTPIVRRLTFSFCGEFFYLSILITISCLTKFSGTMLSILLVKHLQLAKTDPNVVIDQNYVGFVIFAFLLSQLVDNYFKGQSEFYIGRIRSRMRATLLGLIFDKQIKISSRKDSKDKEGILSVSNYIQIDVEQVLSIVEIVKFVIEIIVLGVSSGVVVAMAIGINFWVLLIQYFICFVIVGLISTVCVKLQIQVLKAKDLRMSIVTEVLKNLRYVKAKVFEFFFYDKIYTIRSQELRLLQLTYIFQNTLFLFPLVVSMVTPLVFVMYLINFRPEYLNYYRLLSFIKSIGILTESILLTAVLLIVSTRTRAASSRLDIFLNSDNLFEKEEQNEVRKPLPIGDAEPEFMIEVEENTFRWSEETTHNNGSNGAQKREEVEIKYDEPITTRINEEENQQNPPQGGVQSSPQSNSNKNNEFKLENLSLKVKKGEFVILLGANGSGKSSVISAILKEMIPSSPLTPDNHRINGSISFMGTVP